MSERTRRTWSRASVATVRAGPRQSSAPPPQFDDWRFHDAAAVLSSFELQATLNPLGRDAAADSAAQARLVRDCLVTVDGAGRRRFALKNDVRKQALRRLASWENIRAALQANTTRPGDLLQRTFESLVAGTVKPLAEQSLDELSATLQVLDWLPPWLTENNPALPDPDEVRRRIDWADLRAPFQSLAGSDFRGRSSELATLRDYVGVRAPSSLASRVTRVFREALNLHQRPPLVIHGPGGMGKSTVLARFILEHTEDANSRLPFIYLDCDRPGLVPDEPLTLMLEGVRQLGVQFPAFARAARDWVARWQSAASAAADDAVERTKLTVRGRDEFLESCRVFIDDLKLGEVPLLLVVDTFEEVQYRGRAYVHELWRFLEELQRLVPRLRTVVAGRARVAEPAEEVALGTLDAESAESFLRANGIADPAVARAVAKQVRRNPLSLKLAAQVLRLTAPAGHRLEDLDTGGGLRRKLDDNRIQGELFRRILSHVTRDEVRKLAHPGLVLRRITPELIEHVLAVPCGVEVSSPQQAEELFEALRREVSLVTAGSSEREVRHRPDVRRVMLELLRKAEPDAVRRIEQNAVQYYQARGTTPADRAEEIYHRLGLSEDAAVIKARWLPGVEAHLRGAVEDFTGAVRALLAQWVGVDLIDLNEQDLTDDAWEAAADKQAGDLLALGRPDDALTVLRSRRGRVPPGPLRALEAQALAKLGRMREARLAALDAVGERTGALGPTDLDLDRIIAQADDILGSALTETDPLLRYRALAHAMPEELGVVELGAHWCRLVRRRGTAPPADAAATPALEAAIGESLRAMPDDVLASAPWLLRKLRDDGLVRDAGLNARLSQLLGETATSSRNTGAFTIPRPAAFAAAPPNASPPYPSPPNASPPNPSPPNARAPTPSAAAAPGPAKAASASTATAPPEALVRSALSDPQRQQLTEALLETFRNNSEFESLVRLLGWPGLTSRVALPAPTHFVASRIVRWAEAEGRVGDLIGAARTMRPTTAAFESLAAGLDVVHYTPMNPVATALVDGARPFVGREPLRRFVAGVGGRDTATVLLVSGPRGSGKTYSIALIAYVARNMNHFDQAAYDCSAKDTPHDLARSLALLGGWSTESMPAPSSQFAASRAAVELTQWLLASAAPRRKPLLVAIDDIDLAPQSIREFLAVLALHVANASSPVLYLVLLGMPLSPPLAAPSQRVVIETLTPLTRADVESYFDALAGHTPVGEPQLTAAKSAAAQFASAPDGGSSAKLAEFLGEAARDLLK